MANYSRDSFQDTRNAFAELLGLTPAGASGVRNYVSVRLQQAVPVLDADWNEESDIRRRELELLLARAIGDGVPAGSDGFAILANGLSNNFSIGAGILFNKGWLVYNRSSVNYDVQPYQKAGGVAPELPSSLTAPSQTTTYLVYLDAWESEVGVQTDSNLVDSRIGIETSVRLERVWVVRVAPLAANADPLDPASIPTAELGHRYYPLATINRPPSDQITASMINDLRRTQLSLDALTHAPLRVYDPLRDQNLDATRLALAFQGNLGALSGVLKLTPEVFVYASSQTASAQALTTLNDVRASATSFQQQAQVGTLHRQAALSAMQAFFTVQSTLFTTIKQFSDAGTATGSTPGFLAIYDANLNGSSAADPNSMNFALKAGDLLGAVMAQERLNQALAQSSNALPEGTLALTPISVTPTTAVIANTQYRLTLRLQSFLTSAAGSEPIQVSASAGAGWTIGFQDTGQPDLAVTVTNGQTADLVLVLQAAAGAANTTLKLTARPQRRQQLVYQNPPMPLALGQPVLPSAAPIVTLTYQGPPLQPGNVAIVSRSAMFGGVGLPFVVANLSVSPEVYQITVVAQGTPTGWQAPAQPTLPQLNPNQNRTATITFKTTNQAGATSPVTYQLQVVRVTGGSQNPQPNTTFLLTFQLT
jgi:Family of unknown function (DUF6519)